MGIATRPTRQNGGRSSEHDVDLRSGERSADGEAKRSVRASGSAGERDERLANALGWFSIGLGLVEVAAPRGVARLISVRDDRGTMALVRAMGVREIANGVGILSLRRPARWLWARVAGDGLDLALLGSALGSDSAKRERVAAAMAAVAGVTALDIVCGTRLTRANRNAADGSSIGDGLPVRKSITIGRPVEEVYRFWRDFENLPRFMKNLESVQVTGDRTSHWRARGPAGTEVEWDAEIVDDRPNELISWRSLEGSDVHHAGTVRFVPAPKGRGTEVHVELRYSPPAGKIGATIAKLFRKEPGQEVHDDLRRFKQVMEVGEVVHSDATIAKGPHPARPPLEVTRT